MKKYIALFGCSLALFGCAHGPKPCSYYKDQAEMPIYFKFGKTEMISESKKTVDEGLTYLRNHRLKKVELDGYSDEVGSTKFNMDLSRKRVESVRDYLIRHGVSSTRIDIAWHGEEKGKPYSAHRRVDVTVR